MKTTKSIIEEFRKLVESKEFIKSPKPFEEKYGWLEAFLIESLDKLEQEVEASMIKKFKNMEITIPKLNPEITNEELSVFQVKVLIYQAATNVIEQIRAKLNESMDKNINEDTKECDEPWCCHNPKCALSKCKQDTVESPVFPKATQTPIQSAGEDNMLTKEEIKEFREKFTERIDVQIRDANNETYVVGSAEDVLSYLSEKKKQWQDEVKEKYEPIIIKCNCDDCRKELSKE